MTPIPMRRRRPAFASLALAGAWSLIATPAIHAPAFAEDRGVTRSQVSGYPRCSDSPPASLAQPPAGHGDPNDTDGTEFDTNWIVDGGSGDADIVWFRVEKANIQGYGSAEDADPASATTRQGAAWGEDRLAFTVAATASDRGTIVVTNRISVSGAWVVEGTGVNHVVLHGEALDITGTVHVFERVRAVDARLTATMSDGSSSTDQSWDKTATSDQGESSTTTDSAGDRSTSAETDSIERRVESSATDANHAEVNWSVERRFTGTECNVRVASSEAISVKAQAMVDDVQTRAEVTRFDTVNIVEASYVIDTGDGPGTPGGEDPDDPNTPGGGDGTEPESTTPTEPKPTEPVPTEPVPPQPGVVLPSDPSLPPEPVKPEPVTPEPVTPEPVTPVAVTPVAPVAPGGAVPPQGGTDLPGAGAAETGGSLSGEPDGTAPAEGGADLGGTLDGTLVP